MLTCNVFMWMCWKARRWYACCCRCWCRWKSKTTLVSFSCCGGIIADRQPPNLICSIDFLMRPSRSWRCAQCWLERCSSYPTDFDSIDWLIHVVVVWMNVSEQEWMWASSSLACFDVVCCLRLLLYGKDAKQNSTFSTTVPQPTSFS